MICEYLAMGAGHLGSGVSYSLSATCLSSKHGQDFGPGGDQLAAVDIGEEVSCRPPKVEAQRPPHRGSEPPSQGPFRRAEAVRLQ